MCCKFAEKGNRSKLPYKIEASIIQYNPINIMKYYNVVWLAAVLIVICCSLSQTVMADDCDKCGPTRVS